MRNISVIAIHHSQNRKTFHDIKNLHINEYKWDDIGYHFVIDKNGKVLNGRSIEKVGAHVYDHNENSIGICLIGNFDNENPNNLQLNSLLNLIKELKSKYKIEKILGHGEFPNAIKTCPGKNTDLDKIRKLS